MNTNTTVANTAVYFLKNNNIDKSIKTIHKLMIIYQELLENSMNTYRDNCISLI